MKLSMKQTRALDLLEDTFTSEILFGGGAGGRQVRTRLLLDNKECVKVQRDTLVNRTGKIKDPKRNHAKHFIRGI